MERILYPGSFRPFHNDHLKNILEIQKLFPKSDLFIGVSEHCPRADNFLNATESLRLIKSVVDEEGLLNVQVQTVKRDIVHAFYFLKKNKIDFVFTGSRPTITCLKYFKRYHLWSGEVYELDNRGIHGSKIRSLIEQNGDWKGFVPKYEWDILQAKGGDIQLIEKEKVMENCLK